MYLPQTRDFPTLDANIFESEEALVRNAGVGLEAGLLSLIAWCMVI